TGTGMMHLNRAPWVEPIDERLDRLHAAGKMRETIVVMPDCWTRYGGSQYLDSSATGRYETHVVKELVPFIDGRYRTRRGAASRGVVGKSSGGYGALVLGMRHPDVFGVVGCNSGDMCFEYCYLPGFPGALDAFRKHGGAARWLRAWSRDKRKADRPHFDALNTLAMASCYSPNPRAALGFDLPFDERTGEMRPEVWRRWLRWDPLRMLPAHERRLRRLRYLFLDCGARDEFHLQWGLRAFAARARRLGVRCTTEEFDDGHMEIRYRYDRVLPLLAAKLA
ncbi:MAG TPA: alpha/beta hydrolase-fold protein, partial [Myxococcota bacterium]|nr:alpha/beta hydrolase-fold protein [Myxococcota bacterium]